jgi:hypothetical protein
VTLLSQPSEYETGIIASQNIAGRHAPCGAALVLDRFNFPHGGYFFRGAFARGTDSDRVTRDLEALKLRLIGMKAEDLPENQARQIATEISAIRPHLKRLEADQEWVVRVAKRATQ